MAKRKYFLSSGHYCEKQGYKREGLESEYKRARRIIDNLYCKMLKFKMNVIRVPQEDLVSKTIFINNLGSKNDICLELHFNAYNCKVKGKEALININNNTSKEFATHLLTSIKSQPVNRGIKAGNYRTGKPLYLIKFTKVNTIILEPYFMDSEYIQDNVLANEILEGILKFDKMNPVKRFWALNFKR